MRTYRLVLWGRWVLLTSQTSLIRSLTPGHQTTVYWWVSLGCVSLKSLWAELLSETHPWCIFTLNVLSGDALSLFYAVPNPFLRLRLLQAIPLFEAYWLGTSILGMIRLLWGTNTILNLCCDRDLNPGCLHLRPACQPVHQRMNEILFKANVFNSTKEHVFPF